MTDPNSFEGALAQADENVAAALKVAGSVTRDLKKAKSASALGSVRDLRRALDSAADQVTELRKAVMAISQAYDIDESGWLESGDYTDELLAAAKQAELDIFAEDDRLLCYPSIVRVLPADLALEIDRKRVRGLRPSTVIAQLQRAQNAGPHFKSGRFLASLLGGYDLVVAQQGKATGAVVRLLDIYQVLTLLPGQAKEYPKPEFTRDLYLLDQTGETTVGSTGRVLRWSASSGTRTPGVLTTVARSGQQQRYWGIAFEQAVS